MNGISGFIDDTHKTLEETAKNELTEELKLTISELKSLRISRPFVQIDDEINREWYVCAVLVELQARVKPNTNWENRSAKWYAISEARKMRLMRGFDETLEIALAMRNSL